MASIKNKKQQISANPDFWSSLDRKKQHIVLLVFLFVLPLFLFHASIIGGQQYMGHDVIQWRAGAESLFQHQEQFEETALWATNMFSGMPSTTISHPPQIANVDNTILRILRFIYPAAEMWILLAGAYLMFVLMGMKPLSAVFGAIIIGFSTYIPIIIGAGHNAKFLAYIYIPWIYSGYFLITRSQRNRWLVFFIFALALTLHLRAYHPQVTYFFLFPLMTLFLYDVTKAFKTDSLQALFRHTGWLIAAAVVAILITVQIYWSTLEYSSFSMRGGSELAGTGGLDRNYAFAWSQGWGELLTLLIPGAYGGSELYWGPKTFTSGPHYAGALAFLFFVIGLIKSKHKLKWVFLGPGIASLLFSLGEHFSLLNNFMFNYFPLFDKFRVPEMWLMITLFCFSVPAVLGLDWLTDQISIGSKLKTFYKPVGIAVLIALVSIFIGFTQLSFEKVGERTTIAEQLASQNNVPIDDPRLSEAVSRVMETQLLPEREALATNDTTRFLILVLLGLGLIWAMTTRKISVSVGMMVLCAILAYDLINIDQRYLSDRSLVDGSETREGVIERSERELDRFIQDEIQTDEGWSYRVLPFLDNPFNNATPSYFYPSAGGYSGAKLSYYQDLIDEALFLQTGGLNISVLNMLNIRYLTLGGRTMLPGFDVAFESEAGVVMENQNVLPKAYFVDSVNVLSDQRQVLSSISEDFDAREVAYIADDLHVNVSTDTLASVQITEYHANQISMEVFRSDPGFLVLSEIWYPPGWVATLNGEEINIIRTNYVLRGFEIPGGRHSLELRLEPVWYESGIWLARTGTLLLFGSGLFGLFITYRQKESSVGDGDSK